MPRRQWPKLTSEALLPIFKAFSHLRCPYLTTVYTEFLLKHERVPKQFLRYDRFLSTVWIRHHFCGVIIDTREKYIVTFDGLNLSQNKNNSINSTYIKFARIFRIFKIFNEIPIHTWYDLPSDKNRYTSSVHKGSQKAKTMQKEYIWNTPPPPFHVFRLVSKCIKYS